MLRYVIACLVALVLLASSLSADYLEVRRTATLKAAAGSSSAILLRLEPPYFLLLLEDGQTNGYYHARDPASGEEGWIYRTFVRRFPGEVPEVAVVAGTAPSAELLSRHYRLGKPVFVHERVREGYALAHDARLKIPAWTQYELRPQDLNGPAERSDDFRPDTSIPFGQRAELGDYSNSGYDRGHMAAAEDMARSERVMSDSFLLSNMAPQVGAGFNQQIWSQLEASIRGWVEQRGTLTVITGPVFEVDGDEVRYEVVGANHVAVPTAFFKIVVDAGDADSPQALAFILPNASIQDQEIGEFLVSIDEVERRTGIDFLTSLDEELEEELEEETAQHVW